MKKIMFNLLVVFAFSQATDASEVCRIHFNEKELKVGYTAYKTNEKIAVGGNFTEIEITQTLQNKNAKNIQKALEGLEATVKIKNETSVATGNQVRDKTLFENFFSKFALNQEVKGKITNVKGNLEKGTFKLSLKINKKNKVIPMSYSFDEKGNFTAIGSFDFLSFGLGDAFKSLNQACFELHKGKDGVSKTWSEVQIKIEIANLKVCE